MNVLVCVKQIPEIESAVDLDESTGWVRVSPSATFRMNRFDECAVEEALLIKERFPDTVVEAVSVGPAHAALAVRKAMGMGADRGIHIAVRDGDILNPRAVASWIAAFAQTRSYRLILAGVMAEDDMQGQVGPMVAAFLSWPCATSTVSEILSPEWETVRVEREIEGGAKHVLELDLPAVLTVQTGINTPRYPSLSNLLRAKKQAIETVDAESLPRPREIETILRMEYPKKSRSGVVLDGSLEQKAAAFWKLLKERSLV